MHALVLLGGVADPKWPLRGVAFAEGAVRGDGDLPRRLSPFDEAALETALQLRDADPAVQVSALLVGEAQAEPIVRHAASYRMHRAAWVASPDVERWDAGRLAARICHALATIEPAPDLLLLGREFGDADDGVLPPMLAEALGRPFASQLQALQWRDGLLRARRGRGQFDEWLRLPLPAVVSVTNDKSNRLRHPLMKNVAAAKRMAFSPIAVEQEPTGASLVAAGFLVQDSPRRQAGACRRMQAASELAAYLRPFRVEV